MLAGSGEAQDLTPTKNIDRHFSDFSDLASVAYVKNGDVVLQLERMEGVVPEGGPDAFLADFIGQVLTIPTLLLSRDRRNATSRTKKLDARVIDAFLDRGPLWKLAGKFRAFLGILVGLVRYRPELVICGCLGAPLWASFLSAKLTGAMFIHSRHVDTNNAQISKFLWLADQINHWIVRRADAVVCHGPYTYSQLLNVGVCESRLFEFDTGYSPPVDIAPLAKPISDVFKAGQTILYLGRIHPDKGALDLLSAVTDLLRHNARLNLVYVGGGPATENIRRIANDEGLEDRVHLVGQVAHKTIHSYLTAATVTVTPTRRAQEGRCLSAMESMVCGTPVIAPNGGPFPFLVEHEVNGLLYKTDSVSDLTRTLSRFLSEPALQKQLSEGAVATGDQLREPVRTFSEALIHAINVDGKDLSRSDEAVADE